MYTLTSYEASEDKPSKHDGSSNEHHAFFLMCFCGDRGTVDIALGTKRGEAKMESIVLFMLIS